NVNNVGKAFLVKPGYLAAEADEGGDISSVPADLPDLRAKNGVEIIPYHYDRELINDINDFTKSKTARAPDVFDSSVFNNESYIAYNVGAKKTFGYQKTTTAVMKKESLY
ncbi:MAG: hypothetical protein ACFNX0_06950, partial [Treponema sp.]